MLNLSDSFKVGGEYTLRTKCAKTGKIKAEHKFSNLITDIGLNRLGTEGPSLTFCYVGTGTNPAAVSDTSMGTYLVTSNTTSAEVNTSPVDPTWFHQVSRTYTFNAGTISNNITEVGVGWSNNPVNFLWSRELIKDSAGNPIAITVLPNEILEVVYTLRYYKSAADQTGSFVLNGITYNYTMRRANIAGGSMSIYAPVRCPGILQSRGGTPTLGPVTSSLIGGTAAALPPTVTSIPYEQGTLTSKAVTAFALSQGNVAGGLKGFTIGQIDGSVLPASFQMILDKYIPKTDLNTMSFTFSISWGRYIPPAPFTGV